MSSSCVRPLCPNAGDSRRQSRKASQYQAERGSFQPTQEAIENVAEIKNSSFIPLGMNFIKVRPRRMRENANLEYLLR